LVENLRAENAKRIEALNKEKESLRAEKDAEILKLETEKEE
jgi:hypothetical protein